jgi:hypothetical protein
MPSAKLGAMMPGVGRAAGLVPATLIYNSGAFLDCAM